MRISKERLKEEVVLLLEGNRTIREIAKICDISKSTVHKDLREKLPKIDLELSEKVNEVLIRHKKEGYLKGGEVTKKKYKLIEEFYER